MTLQQLEYIVAVDKYRHFAQAAKACGVAQSTLSSLIMKLETELGVTLFERKKHHIYLTEAGAEIIAQAKVTLYHAAQIEDIAALRRDKPTGTVRLGITRSAATFIVPELLRFMSQRYPDMNVSIDIADEKTLAERVKETGSDMAILTLPVEDETLEEVPLYSEQLVRYSSDKDDCREWKHVYGNYDDLIKLVDQNGGHALIPESYANFLTDSQKANIIDRNTGKKSMTGIVIRKDFTRETLLNIVIDALTGIIPEHMLDSRLKGHRIVL